jgi:hypothetical protein
MGRRLSLTGALPLSGGEGARGEAKGLTPDSSKTKRENNGTPYKAIDRRTLYIDWLQSFNLLSSVSNKRVLDSHSLAEPLLNGALASG